MKEINLFEKINAYLVVGSEKRWLTWQEQKEGSLENFFKRYPSLKDNPLYKEKWGKGISPKKGAKGGGLFPVLCLLQDGRIGCVMRTGMNHVGPGQLSISFSRDKGKTWTPYKIVAEPEGYNDKRDPAFGQAKNGDLVIAYGVYDAYGEDFKRSLDKNGKELKDDGPLNYYPMEVIRSSDGGKSWSKPRQLEYDLGGLYLKPHGQMRQLRNGTLVFNARGFYRREMYERYPQLPQRASYLFWSYDNGISWPRQTRILYNVTESGFLELDEQHWLAYCRKGSGGGPSQIAHSYDGGHIWQDPETPLPEDDPAKQLRRLPGQPTLLPNGKVIMTYGYRIVPFGVRAIVSHDGGKTFDKDIEYVITDSYLLPDCGYPSTVVFPDGTIVTVAYAISDTAHEEWNTCCIAYVYNQDVYGVC